MERVVENEVISYALSVVGWATLLENAKGDVCEMMNLRLIWTQEKKRQANEGQEKAAGARYRGF